MSMFSTTLNLAPVILATGATVGLFVIKVDDPHTKKIIRAIALLLAIGTTFSVVLQIPAVLSAIDEGVIRTTKMLGWDDESRLARIRRDSEIAAAQAKAKAEAEAAKVKADMDYQTARAAAETTRLKADMAVRAAIAAAEAERIAQERRIEEDRRAQTAAIEKAKADAEIARIESERSRRAAELNRQREAENEQRKLTEQRAAFRRRNGGCDVGSHPVCMNASVSGSSDAPTQLGCMCMTD